MINKISKAVINTETLKEIHNMVGEDNHELIASIILSFLDDTPVQIAAIEGALMTQDAKALYHVTYRLRTNSINMGAEKLAEACLHLENISQNSMLDDPAVNSQAIRLAFEEARRHFEEYM